MNSCELVASISAIACALSKQCSKDELSILAAAFTQLGDSIATILAHDEVCNNKDSNDQCEC